MASKPSRGTVAPRRSPNLGAILRYPSSRAAFDKLVEEGIDADQLSEFLQTIVCIPEGRGPLVPGKTDRQTKYFPNRLEELADEIQRIKEESGLMYEIALGAQAEARSNRQSVRKASQRPSTRDSDPVAAWIRQGMCRQMQDRFQELPMILRSYAAYLRYAIKQNRMGWSELQQFAIRRFQVQLYARKRRYYDAEIAHLLTAAFHAAGLQKRAKQFNSDQLKMLRRRIPLPKER